MLINVSDDINIIINRYLDINSILLLRKSYRCNYKITKEHNFVRIINIENNFSINKNDKYNIELKINDFIVGCDIVKFLKLKNVIGLNIIRTGISNYNKLDENIELKELIYNLICKNDMECLGIDIGYFYTLSNYFRKSKKDISKIKIKTICLKQMFELINPYWDLTLYCFKQVVNTFKDLQNIIYLNIKFNTLLYNTYNLSATVLDIKDLYNYKLYTEVIKYYLNKNNINIYLNVEFEKKIYNVFFEKEKSFKLDFKIFK